MATVAEGNRKRIYINPSDEHIAIADEAEPYDVPETDLPEKALGFSAQHYGMTKHRDLFTPRQLVALTTFSDLVGEVHEHICRDAAVAGRFNDEIPFYKGGRGALAYADAVATYLAFVQDKMSCQFSKLSTWSSHPAHELVVNMFSQQILKITWDYGEINPFCEAASWRKCLDFLCKVVQRFYVSDRSLGAVQQSDATLETTYINNVCFSTDPPYYDNIGYADLSDYFYIWLRRSLRHIYPDLFNLMLVPKVEELVANPFRFDGDKSKAESHFLIGFGKAFQVMCTHAHPDYPMTVYYAFKQSEKDKKDGSIASTGWETMLDGLLKANFQITGTWPIRTERRARVRAQGSNALASSIVLVCRPCPESANMATRREFIFALRRELPGALHRLQQGNIAPVDLAQAAIGPGMAVFSSYNSVLEADGSPMRVRTALQIINAELDAYFAEQESNFEADTRFCIEWFELHGMREGPFDEAQVLARAKNISVRGIEESGVLQAGGGKVRLLSRQEYPDEWDPTSDRRINTWECTQYLIKALDQGGEAEAARLANQLSSEQVENARALAYRLFSICERKGWAQEAIAYNTLITSWTHIQEARTSPELRETQVVLFD